MKKLVFPLKVIAGSTLVAMLCGVVLTQILYRLSEELFTLSQFPYYGLKASTWGRAAAAWVGVLMTWKLGSMFGLILAGVSLIQPTSPASQKAVVRSWTIIVLLTILMGTVAWIVNQMNEGERVYYLLEQPRDLESYLTAGLILTFSYWGAIIGLGLAVIYQFLYLRRIRRRILTA